MTVTNVDTAGKKLFEMSMKHDLHFNTTS